MNPAKAFRFVTTVAVVVVPAFAATYYVDPDGTDAADRGGQSNPWRSLSYACSRVTAAGDVIRLNAGEYTETARVVLAPGVDIEGAGMAETVISRALLVIIQDLIGLIDLLEARFSLGRLVYVRVILLGQLAKGPLQGRFVGIPGDA